MVKLARTHVTFLSMPLHRRCARPPLIYARHHIPPSIYEILPQVDREYRLDEPENSSLRDKGLLKKKSQCSSPDNPSVATIAAANNDIGAKMHQTILVILHGDPRVGYHPNHDTLSIFEAFNPSFEVNRCNAWSTISLPWLRESAAIAPRAEAVDHISLLVHELYSVICKVYDLTIEPMP